MKKILLSLLTIVGVTSAMIIGARAAFSDTETSTGNVLAAGTIDIEVNNQNPWDEVLVTADPDLKPGQSKEATFTVHNVGVNDLVLWKKVKITSREGGEETEPELEAEDGNPVEDIDSQVHYDMTVGGVNTIPENWGIMMSDIDDIWIPLGRINAGDSLDVTQIYALDENAGDQYQGDFLTFDIELYAEQLLGPGPSHTTRGVVLENKSGDPDWIPLMDNVWGLLTWDESGNYRLRAWNLPGTQYQMQEWDAVSDSDLGYFGDVFAGGGDIDETDTNANLVNDNNIKLWLRETATFNNLLTLWESNVVN